MRINNYSKNTLTTTFKNNIIIRIITTMEKQTRQKYTETTLHRLWHNGYKDTTKTAWEAALNSVWKLDPTERIEMELLKTPVYSIEGAPITYNIHDLLPSFNKEEYTCWEYSGSIQNGYPVSSTRTSWNQSTKIELHRVALLAKSNWEDLTIMNKGMTASHLCHNTRCIRPSHIICETLADNVNRNYCSCWILIKHQLVHTCLHNPLCLYSGSQRPKNNNTRI
ncbi:hypothetical protein AKO1_001361 [Acrasis kona]|uniref:Zinc-binding loop region of homing endonuclease domain-containing protein n=1 Tax=Acrasis kona TaxID=1008807 RepID=A0AAW2YST4_9EUKA